MAHLTIKYKNKQYLALKLDEKSSFSIGRSRSCDIVLQENLEISRHHATLSYVNNQWEISVLSKNGHLVFNGNIVKTCILDFNSQISIPPYQLIFSEEKLIQFTDSSSVINLGGSNSTEDSPMPLGGDENIDGDDTQISCNLGAFLAFTTEYDEKVESPLIGDYWIIGRGNNCDIQVEDPVFSREQFQIRKNNNHYSISDLSRSNPTIVNGSPIGRDNLLEIFNEDIIQVKDTQVIFEVRNKALAPFVKQSQMVPAEASRSEIDQGVILELPNNKRKRNIRIALCLAVSFIIYGFLQSDKDSKSVNQEISEAKKNNLEPGQFKMVTDMYNLAFNYYTSARYELCLSELGKIHKITRKFKRSDEFQIHCQNGLDQEKEHEDLLSREEEERIVVEKVQFIIKECKNKLDLKTTSIEDANKCFSMALSLDPNNQDIKKISLKIKSYTEERRIKSEKNKAYKALVEKGRRLYRKAKSLKKSENHKKVISTYNKFIKSSYPDPRKLKEVAKRELSSIQEDLRQKVLESFKHCKKYYESKKYKESIVACESTISIDDSYKEAHSIKENSFKNLTKKMRVLYNEAALEESLGNVGVAKKIWRSILKKDHPRNNFYKKASIKLKKHGEDF